MTLRYRSGVVPSKRAAASRAACFAVLGVSVITALLCPLYERFGGSGVFLAAALLSAAVFVSWLPGAPRLPGQGDGDALCAS